MASNKLTEFPDVEAKLQKPSKQSAFEKQRAEAEAKRKREAAETAAVYESFVKSFDNEDDGRDNAQFPSRGGQRDRGQQSFGRPPFQGPGGSRRHFGAGSGPGPSPSAPKSGPGSLGPAPTSYGSKRRLDLDRSHSQDGPRARDRDRSKAGRLGFDEENDVDINEGGNRNPASANRAPKSVSRAFDTSDDEDAKGAKLRDLAEEKATARPTLRLANLPPGTSPSVIKALIPGNLQVEQVKMLPPSNPGTSGGERKSMTSIVTLSQETPATDIDTAVSALQNRYLGYGFYLSLHRHLSSAVTSAAASSALASSAASRAFGAKPVSQHGDKRGPSHHHPSGHRGFAPPSSYQLGGGGPMSRTIYHVPVQAPSDIKQLRLIHKIIEGVLEFGPEFEALLMSRPDVQKEEKWAWLWDARSQGGVWYRWRLWEVVTGAQTHGSGRRAKFLPLFEDSHAWKAPEKPLAYEYTTAIDEFVSDPEYDSSDEDDYEDTAQKPGEAGDGMEKIYLNPLDKAKLTHLLTRLPTTLGRIRKGDIARITSFAITHSSRGADEIVDMIVMNIVRPFSQTSANPEHNKTASKDSEENGGGGESPVPAEEGGGTKLSAEAQDTSASSLVGLYAASDLLSASATSGIRHAWRYRQLFEHALKSYKVFEYLGLFIERYNWGRLRAEKWKRSVGLVLSLWEGWCAFSSETHEQFAQTFDNPPSAAALAGKEEEGINPTTTGVESEELKKKKKWKTVEGATAMEGVVVTSEDGGAGTGAEDIDGEAMEDMVMEDQDGVEMDSDIDGVPMDDDDDDDGEPMDEDTKDDDTREDDTAKPSGSPTPESGQQPPPRRRMRAADMFADEGDSE